MDHQKHKTLNIMVAHYLLSESDSVSLFSTQGLLVFTNKSSSLSSSDDSSECREGGSCGGDGTRVNFAGLYNQ